VILFSSLAEVLSLAAVIPFLAVLANPEGLWLQPFVQQAAPYFGMSSAQDLLLPITLAFAFLSIAAGAIRLLTLWLNGRLAAAIGSDLSCNAYFRTLYQPYAVHVSRNSSDIIASISTDIIRVIFNVLNPLLLMVSSAFIVLGIVGTLLLIDWQIAIGLGLVISLLYAAAMASSKRPLQQLSHRQVVLNRQLIQSLQEGLGAIRDVLLDGSQAFYAARYRQADQQLRRAQAQGSFLSTYPRLVMEPAGIALISLASYVLVLQGGVEKALPLLGALALAAQRLLPMAQKVYEGWAQSNNNLGSLANLISLLAQPLPDININNASTPLLLKNSLSLEELRFSYDPLLPEVLTGVNLEIRRGERIGIIGTTGSGKSTLVDLLMGLLEPTSGTIFVDGVDLHDPNYPSRVFSWRASIAHVPQSIYIADSSIAENIAFGVPKESIDMDRVYKAAEQAQISSFIESTPEGYSMFLGERGIRLSGGQCQRIGIARALYREANLLVLDEATAALDTTTEQAILDTVDQLSPDLTIIMVTHRLATVRSCNRLYRVDKGLVSDESSLCNTW
jgi:ATP-binding cassette subfamily B protein